VNIKLLKFTLFVFYNYMRPLLIILSFMLIGISAQAQSWVPGYFYDVKGNKEVGLIRYKGSGNGPIKDEGFIEFKTDKKANTTVLSASDLSSFIMGRDSFVVAAAPRSGAWSKNEIDFVLVTVDAEKEDPKLYMFEGKVGGGSGGVQPSVGVGLGGGFGGGGGGFGAGFGGGISIPLGGGGHKATSYFYGRNTAEMKELTPANFVDVMSNIMGDEPEIVDELHQNKYSLGNIGKLIDRFYKLQAEHGTQQ
jgi:hypothetical protein